MSVPVPAQGGPVVVWTLVDPPFSCMWSAFSEVGWIIVTSPAFPEFAQGDGEVRFTVEPNDSGVERTGRIRVAEQFLTVVQPAQ